MGRRIITVTHPDGSKKIIVGKESSYSPAPAKRGPSDVNNEPLPKEADKRRAKPIMGKAGTTSTKTAYKLGGKINVRKR